MTRFSSTLLALVFALVLSASLTACTQKESPMEKKVPAPISVSPQTKILFLGDSLTEGYGVSQDQAYPAKLQEILQEAGHAVEVINAGSSGSTSASALERMQWHMQSAPDIVVLALGGNDGLRGVSVDATYDNLAKAIDLAQDNNVPVYLASMKLPYNYGEDYRQAFEETFERLLKDKNIQAVPFMLEGVGGVEEMNLPDGIHPNQKGHTQIAKNLAGFLISELP